MFNSFTPGFIPMHNVLITQEFNLKLMSNQVHKFHCSFYSFTILAIQEWNVLHKGYYIVNLRKLDRDLKLFEWRFLHWGICPQTEIWCRWGVHTETRTQFMRFEVNGCAVWVPRYDVLCEELVPTPVDLHERYSKSCRNIISHDGFQSWYS